MMLAKTRVAIMTIFNLSAHFGPRAKKGADLVHQKKGRGVQIKLLVDAKIYALMIATVTFPITIRENHDIMSLGTKRFLRNKKTTSAKPR